MELLLDTHALLWWLADSQRLRRSWRAALKDPENRVVVSAASIWEIAVKSSMGRLRITLPRGASLATLASACGFEDLPVSASHAAEVAMLPRVHFDPFDRLLVAQARVERLTLVTADDAVSGYEVPVLE